MKNIKKIEAKFEKLENLKLKNIKGGVDSDSLYGKRTEVKDSHD